MQEAKPMLFGEPYSVYVRAVRLVLEEKNVAYELVPVDIFKPGGPPPEHYARHPFGKIPALSTPDFASTKRVRSPDMWTRRFRGLGSDLEIPVPVPG